MKKNISGAMKFAPLPVLMIGTYDENGKPNLMNAAWGGQCDTNEIFISLSLHKTTDNFAKTGAFTIAFATRDTLVESDYFGIETGRKVDKIARAGFHAVKSEKVNAPVFEEYPITMECEVIRFEDGILWGRIVGTLADEKVLDEKGRIDFQKAGIISFDPSLNTYRIIGDCVGEAFKAGMKLK